MKKLTTISFVLATVIIATNIFATSISTSDPQRQSVRIIFHPKGDIDRVERDFYQKVTVYYDTSTSTLEINCPEGGTVKAYLVNSDNYVCDQTEFDSSVYYTETLDVPETSGTYYIFIDTKNLYAEGVFTK